MHCSFEYAYIIRQAPAPPPPTPQGTIGALRAQRPRPTPPPAPPAGRATPPGRAPQQAAPDDRPLPTRDELTEAWGDRVLSSLPNPVRPYFTSGRFVAVEGGRATFALPDHGLLGRAQARQGEAEAALEAVFGRRVPLRLVLDEAASAPPAGPPPDDDPDGYDPADLTDAGPPVVSLEQRLLEAFPGAEEVDP